MGWDIYLCICVNVVWMDDWIYKFMVLIVILIFILCFLFWCMFLFIILVDWIVKVKIFFKGFFVFLGNELWYDNSFFFV